MRFHCQATGATQATTIGTWSEVATTAGEEESTQASPSQQLAQLRRGALRITVEAQAANTIVQVLLATSPKRIPRALSLAKVLFRTSKCDRKSLAAKSHLSVSAGV